MNAYFHPIVAYSAACFAPHRPAPANHQIGYGGNSLAVARPSASRNAPRRNIDRAEADYAPLAFWRSA
jgi:hypothetical protein